MKKYILNPDNKYQVNKARKSKSSDYDFERTGKINKAEVDDYTGLKVEEIAGVPSKEGEPDFEVYDPQEHLVKIIQNGEHLIVHGKALEPTFE